MKICIFIADSNGAFPVPAVKGGAVQTLVDNLILSNKNSSIDFSIVTYYDSKAKQESTKYKNTNYVFIKIPKLIQFFDFVLFTIVKTFFKKKKSFSYKTVFSLLFYIKKSSAFLKRNKFDAVVFENNIPLIKIIKKSKYSGKYFYHFHNVPRTNFGCLEYFLKCDGFLCVSEYVKKQITSDDSPIGKINEKKCKVLYNVIDIEKFRPLQLTEIKVEKNLLNIDDTSKLIFFAGRFSKEKGLHLLIDALSKIENKNLKLVIASQFNLNEKYKKGTFEYETVKKIKNNMHKIILLGYIDNESLYKYYNIADVVVLPSIRDEPAGLTMVEALACNSKLITTNAGGIPEYMTDKCFLIENKSEEYITNQLVKMIPEIIDREKPNDGYKYVKKFFSKEDYAERFLTLLKELLNTEVI